MKSYLFFLIYLLIKENKSFYGIWFILNYFENKSIREKVKNKERLIH